MIFSAKLHYIPRSFKWNHHTCNFRITMNNDFGATDAYKVHVKSKFTNYANQRYEFRQTFQTNHNQIQMNYISLALIWNPLQKQDFNTECT